MKAILIAVVLTAALTTPAVSQSRSSAFAPGSGNPLIDYQGFLRIAQQTQTVRAKRLLPLTRFKAKASEAETLVLDARSAQAFQEGHIDGAVNLPFSDFNTASLRRIIGDNPNRPILIYCNNNFSNNVRPVPTKVVQVALNIQTFINLRAYGYHNVWELADVVDFTDPAVGWVGAAQRGRLANKL